MSKVVEAVRGKVTGKVKNHLCPICQKKFTTRNAMREHEFAVHGLGSGIGLSGERRGKSSRNSDQARLDEGRKASRLMMAGRWASNALNPAEETKGAEGIPDETGGSSTIVRSCFENVEAAPGDTSWDLAVLTLPFHGYAVWKKASSGDTWEFAGVRQAPALNMDLQFDATEWRQTAGSLTCLQLANATQDEGSVHCIQISQQVSPGDKTASEFRLPNIKLRPGKWAPSDMVQREPCAYIGAARDGLYTIQKPSGSGFSYNSTTPTEDVSLSDPNGVAISYNPKPLSVLVDGYKEPDWQDSAVVFSGLNQSCKILVKRAQYLELRARAESGLSLFAEHSPFLDRSQLDMVILAAQRSPCGFPASYNAGGGIWNFLKKALGIVAPVATALGAFFPTARVIGAGLGAAHSAMDTD